MEKSKLIVPPEVASLLNEESIRINSKNFISSDPVQFPRRFSDLRDIEIVAFISGMIAWGRRSMICRDAERILDIMDNQPYNYVMEKGYEDLDPEKNLHRTFFARHLQWFLKGMRKIYSQYSSLDEFALSQRIGDSPTPSWKLAELMQEIIKEENGGERCSQCIATNLQTTALKRINMVLRWLVRDDGIVDMGVWKSIDKSKLFIPLDVHVGNTARELGLLCRKANDRRSVEELTAVLRGLDPNDPVKYDFALFGIGVGVN